MAKHDSASRPRILLVEDEAAQAQVLAYNLEREGYLVALAPDGDEAVAKLDETPPDLVVLDWMLPGISGIEICRRIRARRETRDIPVIMLTARGEEADRVRGLDTGADDYVVKPFSVSELVARVRAHLRRTRPAATGEELSFSDVTMDTERHRVTRAGRPVKLGPTEYRLLSVFMEKPGRVWTREQLLDRAWGRDIYVDLRTVDVHVGRLRKALNGGGAADLIRTVRGAGYALDAEG